MKKDDGGIAHRMNDEKIERIRRMTEQCQKEKELEERHRNKAKEHQETAERHAKRAADLEAQIKYQKGEEVYDRVDALRLTPDELQRVLRLLDDRTQLLDVVQRLAMEEEGSPCIPDGGTGPDIPYGEVPVFGEDDEGDDGDWRPQM